jgi:arabinofuranosyltransferase
MGAVLGVTDIAAAHDRSSARPRLPLRVHLQATLVLLPAATVALYLMVGWARRWTVDDAFINYRVVEQIQAGNGPVFNVGERVEVATSAPWLALLTLADLVSPFRIEWTAILIELAFGAVGMAAGMAGARRLARLRGVDTSSGLVLPLGAVAYFAVTVCWDFATGGLENGLSIAWLGGTFWAVVALVDRVTPTHRRLLATSLLVGIGVVVRPDFAPFCAGFMVPLAVSAWSRGGRRTVLAAGLAAASLPLAVQVFRMGYYGQLVPNTLHAKEGSLAWWSQGWRYLVNFAAPYVLVVPVAATIALLALWWSPPGVPAVRIRTWRLVVAGVEAGAVLHAVAVVRVGGDYLHGRLLLPAWFAVLLPIFAVSVRDLPARLPAVVAAAIGAWAVVCGLVLRPPEGSLMDVVDGRRSVVEWSGMTNPVRVDHMTRLVPFYQPASASEPEWFNPLAHPPRRGQGIPARPELGASVVPVYALGAVSFALPLDVWVYDILGLADPVVARVELDHRGTPGHEKLLGPPWMAAAFVDSDSPIHDPAGFDWIPRTAVLVTGTSVPIQVDVATFEADRQAAAQALACGPLGELVHNVRAPLSPQRFLGNIVDAVRLHSFRFPADPQEARRELCR